MKIGATRLIMVLLLQIYSLLESAIQSYEPYNQSLSR